MDEYDLLLSQINLEKRIKEEKKFWRGKKWTKKQRIELERQEEPPLKINRIKSGQEVQRENMREHMGLSDTGGMTITEENLKKLMADLSRATPVGVRIILGRKVYKDFPHFCSALLEKYFTRERQNE